MKGSYRKNTLPRRVLSHFFDFRVHKWIDYSFIKASTLSLWNQGVRLFTPQESTLQEEFSDAVTRLRLKPDELPLQAKRYLFFSIFFLVLSSSLLIYGIITACLKNWMGLCINIALAFYCLSLAFHFHFWKFQISERKLGCKLKDWYTAIRYRSLKKYSSSSKSIKL